MLTRLQREFVDFVSFFVMPVLALLLPWSLAYRFYYRLAGRSWLFRQRVRQAHSNASKLIAIADDHEWCRRHRLVLMLDVIDFWISFLQPWRVQRLVQQYGDWPEDRPLIIVGTHWGPAFLLLKSLSNAGLKPYYIMRVSPASIFSGRYLLHQYTRARRFHMRSLLPQKSINADSFPRKLISAIKQQCTILVLADTPSAHKAQTYTLRLLGHSAYISPGMFKYLQNKMINTAFYKMGIDFNNGKRYIEINEINRTASNEDLRQRIDLFIDQTISQDTTQWNLWQVSDAFFSKYQER